MRAKVMWLALLLYDGHGNYSTTPKTFPVLVVSAIFNCSLPAALPLHHNWLSLVEQWYYRSCTCIRNNWPFCFFNLCPNAPCMTLLLQDKVKTYHKHFRFLVPLIGNSSRVFIIYLWVYMNSFSTLFDTLERPTSIYITNCRKTQNLFAFFSP